jgi:hypothetical protein
MVLYSFSDHIESESDVLSASTITRVFEETYGTRIILMEDNFWLNTKFI